MDLPGKKELKINILESVQIDFKPGKPKKRRRVDDYDYNDPFLEPFEGEFDVVELECKLENFFIYKGKITEDPKRIARRYNNTLKRQKQPDPSQSSGQEAEEQGSTQQFDFEKRLANSINQNCKYKKDTRFENAFLWTVYVQTPATDFEGYLRFRLLAAFQEYGHESIECPPEPERNDFDSELTTLQEEIETRFRKFMEQASDDKNFSSDMKSFEKFKDDAFVSEMIAFLTKYSAYYACKTDKNVRHTKNLSTEYLSAMLPSKCTNRVKVKYYILKHLCQRMKEMGYDSERVLNGEFVQKSTAAGEGPEAGAIEEPLKPIQGARSKTQSNAPQHLIIYDNGLSETSYSPTNTFAPSFNENSVSIGTELNPSSTSTFANSLLSTSLELKTGEDKKPNTSPVLSSNVEPDLNKTTDDVASSSSGDSAVAPP